MPTFSPARSTPRHRDDKLLAVDKLFAGAIDSGSCLHDDSEKPVAMQHPAAVRDRQLDYFEAFDRRIRAQLRTLVSDAVIEEHRLKPLGQHSDALDRLLNYFRRGGMAGKLGLYQERPGQPVYKIVRFSGSRAQLSTIEHDHVYTTLDEAYHAVFLRRIAELLAS